VIDRGKDARDVKRLRKTGRHRRAEADMRCAGAQRGDQRRRLKAAEEGWVVAGIEDQPIGDEDEIELAALGGTGDLLHDRQFAAAGRRALVAPASGVVAGAEHEHAEMHLTVGGTHRLGSLHGFRPRGQILDQPQAASTLLGKPTMGKPCTTAAADSG
jgi:hypothetical protein